MKKVFFALLGFMAFVTVSNAQNDTMYVMKNNWVVGKFNVNTGIDSVIFYAPQVKSGNFADPRDGNVYYYVTIGDQVWMAENLKYLPSVVGQETGSQTEPYYYVYGYNGTNVADAKATENYNIYGVLYNWPAAMNGTGTNASNPGVMQGICPTGWHLPGDAEWTQLTDYLGGENIAGNKLRETGTAHWSGSNAAATNETGFTALPGGYRYYSAHFFSINSSGNWWSATENSADRALSRYILYDNSWVSSVDALKETGYSIRCLKD